MVKNLLAYAGDMCLIPGSGTSPGEGNGNPLHYFCLGNPMDRGAWWAPVLGVTKESDTTKLLKKSSNNLRNADDTTFMPESKQEKKKELLDESEKVALKLSILKSKIMVSSPVTSWLIIDRETTETVTDFIFLVSKIIVDGDCSFEELMLSNCGVGEDS